MRFRAEYRLRRPREIRAVREGGRKLDCRAFTLWWKFRADPAGAEPATPLPPTGPAARVCVIASTAAVGDAHRRNRAKRRLREVFRQQHDRVPPGCDLLLIARAATIEWPMNDLGERFAAACRQIAPRPATPSTG